MTKTPTREKSGPNTSLMIRGAIWIAIGALVAAALVCVVWVLTGDQQGLVGRAFLTIVLLAAFAGIAILEAGLAPHREDWLTLLSMIAWVVALLVGAVKIWLPDDTMYFGGAERFLQLLLVVATLQLALLHVRLYRRAVARHRTTLTRAIAAATYVFLGVLVAMLVFFLTFPETFRYEELYWRIVVALTILAAVGTMLIPLLNALFAPKTPRPAGVSQHLPAPHAARSVSAAAVEPLPWPTYADARTPLPMLVDGSPDWNAYYTGVPAAGATVFPTPLDPQLSAASPDPSVSAAFPVPVAAGDHQIDETPGLPVSGEQGDLTIPPRPAPPLGTEGAPFPSAPPAPPRA